jgi:hypothetical protein
LRIVGRPETLPDSGGTDCACDRTLTEDAATAANNNIEKRMDILFALRVSLACHAKSTRMDSTSQNIQVVLLLRTNDKSGGSPGVVRGR